MKEYFSHDYNARNDKKLQHVLMKHGVEGIGIFWCVIEMLYEETGYLKLSEYERIAFELRTDTKVVKSIINNFDLFEKDNKNFWSETALERINKRIEKSEKARKSVMKRWNKNKNYTNVKQSKNEGNTSKVKESKVKENKVNNNCDLFIEKFNDITKKKIRIADSKFKRQFKDRLKEGFTEKEILIAVENCKNDEYHKETGLKYLTPEFITRPDKLQSFLNRKTKLQKQNKKICPHCGKQIHNKLCNNCGMRADLTRLENDRLKTINL